MKLKLKILLLVELTVLVLLFLLAVSLYSRGTDDQMDTTGTSQTMDPLNSTVHIVPSQGVVGNPFDNTVPGGAGDNSATAAPATKPNEPATQPDKPATKPSVQSTEPTLPSSKPTESTTPSEPTTRPSVPSTKPSESVKPTEPSAQPGPTTRPTEPVQGTEPAMDYETYINLSATEQKAYRESFESLAAFFEWYNAEKKEYEAQKPEIEVGNGSIDLEDIMGGKNK